MEHTRICFAAVPSLSPQIRILMRPQRLLTYTFFPPEGHPSIHPVFVHLARDSGRGGAEDRT
jgi:hypothetical protein